MGLCITGIGLKLADRQIDAKGIQALFSDDERFLKIFKPERFYQADLEAALPLLELSKFALAKAISQSNLHAHDIGGLILCTNTPDTLLPASVSVLHSVAFEQPMETLQLCAGAIGPVQAMHWAMEKSQPVAIVAADINSKWLSHGPGMQLQDKVDALKMSDAAGAIIVGGMASKVKNLIEVEYLDFKCFPSEQTSGTWVHLPSISKKVSKTYYEDVNEESVVARLASLVVKALDIQRLTLADFQWVVVPEISLYARSALMEKMGATKAQTISSYQNTGWLRSPNFIFQVHMLESALKSGGRALVLCADDVIDGCACMVVKRL